MTGIKKMTQKAKNGMLEEAVWRNNVSDTKNALELGANPDIRGVSNNTPLIIASDRGYTKIVRLLLKHGAKVNAVNKFKITALDYASHRHYLDIVKILIDAGADVNMRDNTGWTAMTYMANQGDMEGIAILLNVGADTSIKNELGHTALDILKSKYPDKYNLLIRQHTLKREDVIETGNFYSEPDFNI